MTMAELLRELGAKGLARLAADSDIPTARFYEAAARGVQTVRQARRLSEATKGRVSTASLLGLSPEECAALAEAGDIDVERSSHDTAPAGTFETATATQTSEEIDDAGDRAASLDDAPSTQA